MEKGGRRVGEEEIVPVGVFDGVDDLDIRHFNLKFHHRDRGLRPLRARSHRAYAPVGESREIYFYRRRTQTDTDGQKVDLLIKMNGLIGVNS
jgi:hypothetical protein